MKKQIQDHILVKNKSYKFSLENGDTYQGKIKDIKFHDSNGEEDFAVVIEFEDGSSISMHCTDEVDVEALEEVSMD